MKPKTLLLLSVLLLSCFAQVLLAQVTITQNNFPRTAGYNDTLVKALTTGLSLPTEGPAQQWDYSHIMNMEVRTQSYLNATGDTLFPGSFNRYGRDLKFQSFVIPSIAYSGIDAQGWYDKGKVNQRVAYSIASISGGANDSLIFPYFVDLFEGRIDKLKFPLSYPNEWQETLVEKTAFELIVAAFGLNRAPGLQKRFRTERRKVVGYGQLILPNSAAQPSPGLDVLLLKVVRTVQDSFFLGGAVAPPALMAAFGLAQGQGLTDSFYIFYKPDFGAPVMDFDIIGTQVGDVFYRPKAGDVEPSTGIRNLELIEVSCFPNPVAAGQSLHLRLGAFNQAVTAKILDTAGREVHQTSFKAGASRTLDVLLPGHLSEGMYLLQIQDEKGNLRGNRKLLIH